MYTLLHEMPYDELLHWLAYFEKRPVGWRDDNRAFKIMQTFGAKGSVYDHFPSMIPVMRSDGPPNPVKRLKGSMMFQKMLSAKGGDKIPLE
jgi:hypothetical protein